MKQSIIINDCQGDIDIAAEKNSIKYCVEVKYSQLIDKAAMRIVSIAEEWEMVPVLVISKYLNSKKGIVFKKNILI